MKLSFIESDTVLLQAILSGCGSSSIALSSLFQMISTLGYAPLTFDQLDGGLARLIKVGLIRMEDRKITPSTTLMQDSDVLLSDLGDTRTSQANLQCYLDSLGGASFEEVDVWKTGVLTPQDYDAGFV